jgi:polysaccharide deacetylase family protein (PEP-CTERM system associated)
VEEHFHAHVFERVVPRTAWDREPSRVSAATERILDLLERFEIRGTFFIVGWVAQRVPDLVRRIAGLGHEVASHSWSHPRINTLTPEAFREELRRTKETLEDLCGEPVTGFRAPSFSILPGMEWAFDVLLETGHTWDSSVFPIRRPGYGWPGAPRRPYEIVRPGGTLRELPMATVRLLGARIPAAGGAYLRHFPFWILRRAFMSATREGTPAMFYLHPWEVDLEQPRIPVSRLNRLRHYGGMERTLPRLERLLSEFAFGPVREGL